MFFIVILVELMLVDILDEKRFPWVSQIKQINVLLTVK